MVQETIEKDDSLKPKPLKNWAIVAIFFYATAIFGLIIILPASDWGWIEGWIYILSFTLIITIFCFIINKKNPTVLRNRMKLKKTGVTDEIKKEASSDRWLMPILGIFAVGTWIVPGFNQRYGWTGMSLALKIIGFIVAICGMIIFNAAQLQNAYASKLLDINEGQKLIDTGMYAYVRHPLYSGGILLYLGTPFALGFWYAIIPAVLTIAMFLVRIKYEETMLIKGMEGYEEYRTRVKYKLFPKIY